MNKREKFKVLSFNQKADKSTKSTNMNGEKFYSVEWQRPAELKLYELVTTFHTSLHLNPQGSSRLTSFSYSCKTGDFAS